MYLVQQYHYKLKYTRKHKINSYISYVTNEPDLLDIYVYYNYMHILFCLFIKFALTNVCFYFYFQLEKQNKLKMSI